MGSRERRVTNLRGRNPGRPRRRSIAIMDAAAQVFAERGFHGASTQDIADVLGIRQASLYYYFPSKEVALEEVCLRGVEGFLEQAIAVAGGAGSAREKIERIIHTHLMPLGDRRAYVRTFLNERQFLPTESRRRIGRLSRAYERLIEHILKTGAQVAAPKSRRPSRGAQVAATKSRRPSRGAQVGAPKSASSEATLIVASRHSLCAACSTRSPHGMAGNQRQP